MTRPKNLDGVKGVKQNVGLSIRSIKDFAEAMEDGLKSNDPRAIISAVNSLVPHALRAAEHAGEWSALKYVVDGTYRQPGEE